jgi:hypothetical protein
MQEKTRAEFELAVTQSLLRDYRERLAVTRSEWVGSYLKIKIVEAEHRVSALNDIILQNNARSIDVWPISERDTGELPSYRYQK